MPMTNKGCQKSFPVEFRWRKFPSWASASTQQMALSTKGFGTGINVENGMGDSILIDFLGKSIRIFIS